MTFNTSLETNNGIATISLSGELDANTAPVFKEKVEEVVTQNVKRLVLLVQDLKYMSSTGLRVIIFTKQKMGLKVNQLHIYVM